MILSWVSALLALAGAIFILIASIGLLRMPDLFMRMHAATKAGTVGAGFILTATLLYFQQWLVSLEALLTIIFLALTAPIAAHLIARAGYISGVPLSKKTKCDELQTLWGESSQQ